jgi:hypothetical protein
VCFAAQNTSVRVLRPRARREPRCPLESVAARTSSPSSESRTVRTVSSTPPREVRTTRSSRKEPPPPKLDQVCTTVLGPPPPTPPPRPRMPSTMDDMSISKGSPPRARPPLLRGKPEHEHAARGAHFPKRRAALMLAPKPYHAPRAPCARRREAKAHQAGVVFVLEEATEAAAASESSASERSGALARPRCPAQAFLPKWHGEHVGERISRRTLPVSATLMPPRHRGALECRHSARLFATRATYRPECRFAEASQRAANRVRKQRIYTSEVSSRRYSPTSAWWKHTMAVGSSFRHSCVEWAVTPKPERPRQRKRER